MCCETLDWALREMRGPEGGFCSALDADSEGVEGKFYVWTIDELREALGRSWPTSRSTYFRPATVRARPHPRGPRTRARAGGFAEIRRRLLEARSQRVRPGLDDKRLTSWNALMISALAEAGAALERPDYVDAAVRCATFVLRELRDGEGRLLRTWKDGRADYPRTWRTTRSCSRR